MATITGLTAARMLEIEAASVVDGDVVVDELILTKKDGSTINAGNVRGPIGSNPVASDQLQAGVINPGDCVLTVNTSSQVTIAAGIVWVNTATGLLVRTTPVSTVLSSIPGAVNNRIDQVVVSSAGVISRLQGTTDVAGNTLPENSQVGGGRAVIPAGSKLMHEIQVTSAGVLIANCRDRRSWARGALFVGTRFDAKNITTSPSIITGLDAFPILEILSGLIRLSFSLYISVPLRTAMYLRFLRGASDNFGSSEYFNFAHTMQDDTQTRFSASVLIPIPIGRSVFSMDISTFTSTSYLYGGPGIYGPKVSIEEILIPSAVNT